MKSLILQCVPWALLCGIPLLLAATAMPGSAAPAKQQLVIRELLNQTYANELVTFPFTARKGTCKVGSLTVAGPAGPVAVQCTNVEYWSPKTRDIKSARLAFIVDELKPLATNKYTVTYGTKSAAKVGTDLQVMPGKDNVQITTSHLGVRFPLGKATYAMPIAWKDTPTPMLAIQLDQGPWTDGSTLHGDAKVSAWSAQLVDAGPVFARVKMQYAFTDGKAASFIATIAAGDNAVRWEMAVQGDQPAQAATFSFGPLPGVTQCNTPRGWGQWARDRVLPVAVGKSFGMLSPDSSLVNIFTDSPPYVKLTGTDGRELQIRARDAGAWVDPAKPFTYGGRERWKLDTVGASWELWRCKRMPMTYTADSMVTLDASLAAGRRKWSVGAGMPRIGERLDYIKDLVLDWPRKADEEHPHLYVSKAEMEAAWQRGPVGVDKIQENIARRSYLGWAAQGYLASGGSKEIAQQTEVVAKFHELIGKLGDFDTMRHGMAVASVYDALIDSDLIDVNERALLRAQIAYLGYVSADPVTWSIERGFHSGNPNMSVSYVLTLGLIACLIPDHPKAKAWADYANGWMEKWLSVEVGSNGEWLSEGQHYGGQVSLTPMLAYAVAAKRAGFHDFTTDERLKKMTLFYAKEYTPGDPRRGNRRVSPPLGRGLAGETNGGFGIAAKMTADSDPAYSRMMQWVWAQSGYPLDVGDWRLGGFETVYMDKNLPMEAPAWGTDHFPTLGAVMRDGTGMPDEHQVNIASFVDSQQNLDVWTPEVGGIHSWFAYGQPISQAFSYAVGYNERHELLRDGVLLARNFDGAGNGKAPFGYYTTTTPEGFSALPRQDYTRATYRNTTRDDRDWFPDKMPAWPTVTAATTPALMWTRQALYVKDAALAGPHWLLLRDTTAGGQPTQWQFWSLTQKLGTPAQARDTNFLADAPGKAVKGAGTLPMSDRYTGIGQFGVDLDYFIASPANTPRHTLRYGGTSAHATEYEDLLSLQQPGDGVYYLAIVPRRHATESPVFATLDGGKIVKVSGAFGADYAFLASDAMTAAAEDIRLAGTAGSIQVRADGANLSLAAAGEAQWKAYGLHTPFAAALSVAPDALTLTLPADHLDGALTVLAPAGWQVKDQPAVKMTVVGERYEVSVPTGTTRVQFTR